MYSIWPTSGPRPLDIGNVYTAAGKNLTQQILQPGNHLACQWVSVSSRDELDP